MLRPLIFLATIFAHAAFADRSLLRGKAEAELAALESAVKAMTEDFERELHEWESDLHTPVQWEPLKVLDAVSRKGKLEALSDGSLRAPEKLAEKENYTIRATTALRKITAFRVEVLPERGIIGRNGNAILSEFQVTGVTLALASADYAQKKFGPEAAIDGNPKTGWAFAGSTDKPHAAVFELTKPLNLGAETVLTFTLRQDHSAHHLNRIRISATAKEPPVRELPESIRQTIALEPSERTGAQQTELADYFRPMSKVIAAMNQQIAAKRAELTKIKKSELPANQRRK